MLSIPILKQTIQSNAKLWIIFTLTTSLLLALLIAVFDPSTISSMTSIAEGTPLADMLKNSTFLGMLSSTFYTLHGVLLPIIYIIMTANSLIAAQVDKGSMAYLLSTPTKRTTVVLTQAIFLTLALVVMFTVVTLVGIASIHLFQSDVDIDSSSFILLNIGLLLLMFAISGISFLFSCVCNLSKNSLAFGAGIPLAFFLFDLMSSVSGSLDMLRYVSLNTLFARDEILAEGQYLLPFGLLVMIGIVLYSVAIRVFKEKDLPL